MLGFVKGPDTVLVWRAVPVQPSPEYSLNVTDPVIDPEADPHAWVPSHPTSVAESVTVVPITTVVLGWTVVTNVQTPSLVTPSHPLRCQAKAGEARTAVAKRIPRAAIERLRRIAFIWIQNPVRVYMLSESLVN